MQRSPHGRRAHSHTSAHKQEEWTLLSLKVAVESIWHTASLFEAFWACGSPPFDVLDFSPSYCIEASDVISDAWNLWGLWWHLGCRPCMEKMMLFYPSWYHHAYHHVGCILRCFSPMRLGWCLMDAFLLSDDRWCFRGQFEVVPSRHNGVSPNTKRIQSYTARSSVTNRHHNLNSSEKKGLKLKQWMT